MRLLRFLAPCAILAGVSTTALSQGFSALTLRGGYAFAVVEESDASAAGWRANLLFEQGRTGSAWTHGGAVGFAMVKASVTAQATTRDYTVSTLPLSYSPRYTFGGESVRSFVTAAVGLQFSWLTNKESGVEVSDNDFGFYGGFGAGFTVMVSGEWFITAEYEGAYLSNAFYRDGFLHSLMAGVGMKL
jgi:hypothetical protein